MYLPSPRTVDKSRKKKRKEKRKIGGCRCSRKQNEKGNYRDGERGKAIKSGKKGRGVGREKSEKKDENFNTVE